MQRLIIGLTGHPGTGKSTAAAYLADKYGFYVFESSQALKDDAAAAGVTLKARKDYIDFYRQQQAALGLDYLARRVIESDEPRILQAGLRSRPDFELLHAAGGVIVALVADAAAVLQRIDHHLSKNATSLEEYRYQQQIDDSPNEFGTHTSWVVEHADYQIDTSGPLKQTQAKLDQVMAEILSRLDQ